ncbi:STAS domain-containing protein [Gordonia paraffinivorans]|uniref:STAS domain-containing protein n=1 Tax=Gordonia paraffinivorans TaxID=175628 RepID=UPI001FF7752F|nr:STAS domain-containing protein [Gordonia paraffinivorans]
MTRRYRAQHPTEMSNLMPLSTSTTFRSAFGATTKSVSRSSTRRFDSSKSYCVQGFSGSIDAETGADFAIALDRVVRSRCDGIVLDLTAVNFFGTVGLVLLGTFVDDATRASIPVVVAGERTVSRPLEVSGLTAKVRIYETLEEAGRVLADGGTGPSTVEFAVPE